MHDPLRLAALTNQCPLCFKTFTSRQQACAHMVYYGKHTSAQVLKIRDSVYDLIPLATYEQIGAVTDDYNLLRGRHGPIERYAQTSLKIISLLGATGSNAFTCGCGRRLS
eukprot:13816252-Heterocapsa_arctica.AAC.1